MRSAIKQQVFSFYKGIPHRNEAYHLVLEFCDRQRLAELGYTSSLQQLSYRKGKAFCFIGQELDRLKNEDLKRRK